jgi:hypothetical protein
MGLSLADWPAAHRGRTASATTNAGNTSQIRFRINWNVRRLSGRRLEKRGLGEEASRTNTIAVMIESSREADASEGSAPGMVIVERAHDQRFRDSTRGNARLF